MKKQYSSKERKIWKLKRKNVKLGQQKRAFVRRVEDMLIGGNFDIFTLNTLVCVVVKCSEQIGRNSLKIQRLRTLIQQEKKSAEV